MTRTRASGLNIPGVTAMVSNCTAFTRRSAGAMMLAAGMAVLAACAPTGAPTMDGLAVDPNQPVRVALLAPLGSGDPGREQLGRSIVNAARLAQADLRNATIDLQVYSSRGSTEGGAAAASQAVAEGAQIIIGPLFSTETAGAQPVAAGAGLTVISLSNNPEVAGGNVYLIGNTFNNTADRLVAYGRARGLRNYGVVYPEGLEGETARNAVAEAVRAGGGNLVASESYSLSVASIQAMAGSAASRLIASGANAVILTDGPTGGLSFVASGLRDNGLPASQAQFLGLQRWDVSAEALTLPALQGGAFAAPDPGLLAAFEGRYANTYGEAPTAVAGYAYDAVAAVGALIAEARGAGGSPFSAARMTQPAGFAGVNGPFRFLSNGMNQRNLAIIEVRNGQAVVTERAPRSFTAFGN
jgi:ABC-type branched-subunit amino acid transport system substrate-binding protein